MPEGQIGIYIIILVSMLLSAFFSSSEAAFLSLQRTRITHLVSTGVAGASAVARMMAQPERLLPTILLGNNLVNVAFAAMVTVLTLRFLDEGLGVAVATALATGLLLVFGEVVPKTVAIRHSERVAFLYVRPLRWLETLLWPFVIVLQRISSLFGGSGVGTRWSVTEAELRTLIDIGEAEGAFEREEAEMLESVFRFGDRQVREVMTPRTEIVFVERGAMLNEFLDTYAEHPHTRFPVYKGSKDNIVGILSAKDILKAMSSRAMATDGTVTDVIRDAYYVPETKRIAELFDELRKSGNQTAIAIDEFGGIAGLVTLKRLLEEVVGRVGEEGVSPEEEYESIGKNTFQVDGGMSIDEAKEQLGIEPAEGEFETIAGFVLEVLGHIPTQGEQFEYGDLKVEVTEMKNHKIETVKLTKVPRAR
jgi:CBS domain containing-hemolysin-like protein